MPHSALAYDTAAAAAVWQRVSPAMPAFTAGGEGAGPEGAALRPLIDLAAALHRSCRRCARAAPGRAGQVLTALAREQLNALRALLAAHYLQSGVWYQPPLLSAEETPPAATLRELYRRELALARGCAAAAENGADMCLRRLLDTQRGGAEERAERLAGVLENSLTIGNNLLKW